MHDEKLDIVFYSRDFLDLSWIWLNDPEIKKLTGTPDFTKEKQEDFFLSLPKEDYLIWGLMYENKPIGVVGLKKIKNKRAEYFGYIGDKSYWGKGLFTDILRLILNECCKINLNKIYLKVSTDNHRAINAYLKNKFKFELDKCTCQQKYMSLKVSCYEN
ncbi:MAG: GNAT family N-acetyltransferase [Plesiomonas sp.]|uniref:GNAT family N-acetyltransferase n=1 Tax=Plesiomonas sp. TaxID=2486279 RepID=UPI003F401989